MTEYPYGGGPWPPSQLPHPAPAPSHLPHFGQHGDYQAPNHQPPPAYPNNPYPSAPVQFPPSRDYFAETQAAFHHNALPVPGLGITTPASGHNAPAAPAADWYEPPPVVAPVAAPQTTSSYAQRSTEPPALPQYAASGSFLEQFRHHQSPVPEQTAQPPLHNNDSLYKPPPPPATETTDEHREEGELEEGELSDDDMEDLYNSGDGNRSGVVRTAQEASKQLSLEPSTALADSAAIEFPSRDASVIDLQEDAFYDEDDGEEPGEIKSTASDADADDEDMGFSDSEQQATPPPQERAVSYSPRLSPGEVGDDLSEQAKGDANPVTNGTATGDKKGASQPADTATSEGQRQPAEAKEDGFGNRLPYTTVEDAKKEAQRAILKLMPYGVNYQTYIDEGFDETTIQLLFAELGLKAVTPPTASSPPPVAKPAVVEEPEPSAVDDAGKKQEERKDRIARLLAMKASKPAAPVPAAKPAESASQKPKAEKTKSEKERLLQQKLDALRRKQGQRAAAGPTAVTQGASGETRENAPPGSQLPAHDAPVAPAIPGQHTPNSAKTPPPPVSGLLVSPLRATGTSPSLTSYPNSSLPPRPQTASQSLPPAPQPAKLPQKPHKPQADTQPTPGQRKRPVAADFDELSTATPNPLKRPFGQMRPESSLVIDVSDDSDDEDVEMEVDSQTDEPVYRPSQAGNGSRTSASFRDHPPLSESPFQPRAFGRPISAVATPPNGFANGSTKIKDAEYARKMRQIEEMKRKIAEAEAKKTRDSRAGTQSPRTGESAPPDMDTVKATSRRVVSAGDASAAPNVFVDAVSARLPKPSDKSSRDSHESRHQLRDRIVSQQLPKVEAGLKEKMFKLKLFQDKIAALQAEIDATMLEKDRLTKEADELAHEPQHKAAEAEDQSGDDIASGEDSTAAAAKPEAAVAATVIEKPANTTVTDAQALETPAEPLQPAKDRDEDPGSAELPTASVTRDTTMHTSEETTPVLDMSLEHDLSGTDEQDRAVPEVESEFEPEPEPEPEAQDEDSAEDASDNQSEDMAVESGQGSSEASYEPTPEVGKEDIDTVMEDAIPEEQGPIIGAAPTRLAVSAAATTVANGNASSAPAPPPAATATSASSTFVPYESPLKIFRSYRFHPQYREQVKGGLKSLTYSGSINPSIELCPYELDGQECAVQPCRFQHIASMVPQDDKILVELGRSDDFTGERKAEFVNGLREVLKRFRDAKVRDFDTIAYEIIDFRRKFLGDDSKILSQQEDVTI